MRPKHAMARPSVLDDERKATILAHVAAGNFLATACRAAGISPSAVYHWGRRVAAGDPRASRHADFFHALARVEALAEAEAVQNVREGRPGWRASAFYLARRFPDRWARRSTRPGVR